MTERDRPEKETTRSRLPVGLRTFVDCESWTYAKTMPKWPHEYIVRDRVEQELFEQLVLHILEHGREGNFYQKTLVYFEEDGLLYWTMGSPLRETAIINRCRVEDSYENRRSAGTLPAGDGS